MKTLVLTNEDFLEMTLGQNTTLAYILAAVDLDHEVNICNIAKDPKKIIKLTQKHSINLIKKFQDENQALNSKIKVKDIQNNFKTEELSQENDLIINRLEPMKSPFPPVGKVDIKKYLKNLTKTFKGKKFNNPANCYLDKELPLVIEKKFKNLATPTKKMNFFLMNLPKNFGNKLVFKPCNSAQGFGVFKIEFCKDGCDLAKLKNSNLQDLVKTQSYKISTDVISAKAGIQSELKTILEILCYLQFCAANNITKNILIKDIKNSEIKTGRKKLYGDEILAQPFLEGVKLGDIRINLAKNKKGDFEIVGAVFRKNINENEGNFTTGVMSGHAQAVKIEEVLSEVEQTNLAKKIAIVVQSLNGFLKKKYQDSLELGCDFLLKGDGNEVYLGEVNHYCQALIPHSESLERTEKNSFYKRINGVRIAYDGGLGMVKHIVSSMSS